MDTLVNQIWAGRYPEQSGYAPIHRKFLQNLENVGKQGKTEFEKKLGESKSNLERIQTVKQFYEWTPFKKSEIQKYQKSDAIAQELRQRGNEFYKIKKFQHAIKSYNLALSFASPGGQELPLVYGNRSAVFVQTKRPLLALRDISRSFINGYPEHLKGKLLERKLKCVKDLNMDKMDENKTELGESMLAIYQEETQVDDDETRKRHDYCRSTLFKLKSSNPLTPSAEDFVKIETTPERGRHVIVTQDVKPGTLLIVDQPFAKILLKEKSWEIDHCHFCYRKKCDNGIPCPRCIFAFYCTEKCMADADKKFHHYECELGPHLHLMKPPRTVLLALRILSNIGRKHLEKIYESSKEIPNVTDGKILGTDDNNIYNSHSYLPIFNLIHHPKQHDSSEIISYCLTSLCLTTILSKNSSLCNLDSPDALAQDCFLDFVASLILLHMQNLPCNAHSLNELVGVGNSTTIQQEDVRNAVCAEYGAGAFALLSLINHSCDPNVYRVNIPSGQTAVVTIRGLKSGEEVLDNYGSHYAIDEPAQRKKHLLNNYFFQCECIACISEWPLWQDIKSLRETFVCTKCNNYKLSERYSPEYIDQCVLSTGQSHCRKCGTQYDIMKLHSDLNMEIDVFMLTCYENVLANKPLEALPQLVVCLAYFENNLLPPFIKTNDAQETLKQALNLIVHFSNFYMM